MRALLSIVAIAAYAAAATATPHPRCASLETACADVFIASDCEVHKKCIPLWENLRLPVGNDTELCATCKRMVKEARDNLMSNMTQGELREVLEGSCDDLIPINPFNEVCKKLMDAFQDELNDMLVSRMDPTQVCTVSGLCWKPDGSDIEQRASDLFLRKSAGKTCESCVAQVGFLARLTGLMQRSDVVKGFSAACHSEGYPKSKCDAFAQTYVAKFIHQFNTGPPQKTCQFFGRCDGLSRPMPVGVADVLECEFCEAMIHKVVVQFNNTSMKDEVKTVLSNICKDTGSWASKCQEKIEADFDKAYDEVISMLDPVNVCSLAGICSSKQSLRSLPMAKLTPARSAGQVMSEPGTVCEDCQVVAKYLVAAVNDNCTEEHIMEILDKGCDLCPIDHKRCERVLNKDIDKLFELLRENATAEKICEVLGLCGAPAAAPLPPPPPSGSICEDCKVVANYLVRAVNDDRSEENIRAVLDKGCDFCPIDHDRCTRVINTNLDKLYELLREKVTAENICEALKLCGAPVPPPPPAPTSDSNCDDCQVIAGYLVAALNDDRSEANIKAVLDKGCELCPIDYGRCTQFINTNLDKLYQLLRDNVTADQICKALGLCGTKSREVQPTVKSCGLCSTVVNYIIHAVKLNSSEAAILDTLERVCKVLPVDKVQCQNYIDVYGGYIITLIEEDLAADAICAAIGLCGAPRPKVRSEKMVCNECELIAGYLVSAVNDNRSEENIKAVIEMTCQMIPMNVDSCQIFIDTNIDKLYKLLRQGVTVDNICRSLRLCARKETAPSPVRDDVCTYCKMISDYLIDALKDNDTDSAIASELEKVCQVLPVDKGDCRGYVDQYSEVIIKMIRDRLTSDEICAVIHACRSQQRSGQVCTLCDTIATFVIQELKDNKTEAAVLDTLSRVCKVLPVDKVQCRNIIDVYGGMIISYLDQGATSDEICAALGLCAAKKVVRVKVDKCAACKMITGFLVDELKDNKTDEAIIEALEKVCKVVPVDNVQCKNYIDVYGDMVIEMIKNNVSADEICASIGFCTAQKVSSSDTQLCTLCEIAVHVVEAELQNNGTQKEIQDALEKACSLMPRDEQVQCRNMVTVYTTYLIDMVESLATAEQICQTVGLCPAPPTPPKCEVCLFITNFAESELGDNRTEAHIQQTLGRVCDYIPNMDVPQCKETIKQFSDMFITLLLQTVPPRKICEEVKLCPLKANLLPAPKPKVQADEKCSFCKWLVTWVDEKLQDNRTEAAIVGELDKACDMLSDAAKCKDMVNDYTDMIVKMLIQYAEPERVCEAIKKCPAKQLQNDEPPCRYCRYVIDELRQDIQMTEAALKQKLAGICKVIPVDPSACQAFVDQYADQIIQLILSDADPEKICEILGVCPKKVKASSTKCNFCREFMQFVTSEVRNESTDDEIVAIVEKACNYVPLVNREDCRRMVEVEGLVLVRMIGQSLDPDSICAAIKYCPEKRNAGKLTCSWCQYALHFIQGKLYDNTTQQVLRQDLEKMCTSLPTPELSSECKEFVDTYGPSLEVIIAQDLDPSVICPAIHACPAPERAAQASRQASSHKCHDCVSSLKEFRHNPRKMCRNVSLFARGRCVGASSVALQMMNAFESDFKLCKHAKRCSDLSGSFRCNRGGCVFIQ